MFALFVGFTAGTKLGFMVCAGIGFWLSRTLARVKADKHPSFAMHWAYWALPTNPITAMRCTPPSHIRRMVG